MEKVHVCVYILHRLHIALNLLLGSKLGLFLSAFLVSTNWFLILAEAFRNHHAAAYSTVLRSATEMNEMGGYVTVPCSSKTAHRSSTADWIKF